MNYTLKVAEIRKETLDTVTLCFKQPGLKKIKYTAGQYLTLIFRINGRRYVRPYSFSSCFGVDSFIEVTIKRVINGIVSNHVIDAVKEGDTIEVMPPMGDFTFDAEKGYSAVYLWGVGSGITPLIAITKHILNFEPNVSVYLIYGNRNNESTIFFNQIADLETKFDDRFIVKHFHTRLMVDENNPYVIKGRIDDEKAASILNENPDLQNAAHYICGPAGLKESVKKALSLKSISADHIYSEDFELVKDPKDFEDVFTQTISLDFSGRNFALEVVKGQSVLEAALQADIELPYSCQTGNCSTCKGKLVSGESRMIGLDKKREDLAADEYLLCCTYPITDNVHIEI